jgi:sodium/proline symporter
LVYTFLGGFIAVAWTDLFQAIFLLAMIFLVPISAYRTLHHGVQDILTAASNQKISLSLLDNFSLENVLTALILMFGWGLGYFGQPHIVTKFMGIRDPNELHKSKYVGLTWMLLVFMAAIAVGLIGLAYFETPLEEPQLIFINMVKELFSPLTGGFVLCGVLSATITTMGSQILVCASVVSQDLYLHFYRPQASQKELLWVTRLAVFIISLAALGIAFTRNSSIQEAVSYAWSGLGSSFGPLVLFGLYSEKTNHYGAIAGIIVGGAVGIFWPFINPYLTDYPMMSMIPGFIMGSLSIYLVSMLSRKKENVFKH